MPELNPRQKMCIAARDNGWPVEDLLDFYRDDVPDIKCMALPEVRALVRDYCINYAACRDEPDAKLLTKPRTMK